MKTADDMDFSRPGVGRLGGGSDHLLKRHLVSALLTPFAVKRAEFTA